MRRSLFSILIAEDYGYGPTSFASAQAQMLVQRVFDDGQRQKRKERQCIQRTIDVMAGATVEL